MTHPIDRDDDVEVDRLYQLPLDQFIQARNELARSRAGANAAAIRALPKPNVLAWALNQLYWSKRETFERLLAAAAGLRTAQAETLMGRPAGLRAAGEVHREAIREALREAVGALGAAGHAVTPDAVRELTGALEALPWKDRPGRLARPPSASGFDALAGMPMAPQRQPMKQEDRPTPPEVRAAPEEDERRRAGRKRQDVKTARDAVAAARRKEADVATHLREAERQLEIARQCERAARAALEDAERSSSAAEHAVRTSAEALQAAREAAADAARHLRQLEESAEVR